MESDKEAVRNEATKLCDKLKRTVTESQLLGKNPGPSLIFPGHSKILSCSCGEKSHTAVWEWPGNKATLGF